MTSTICDSDLPLELLRRTLLGLDVQSLCAASVTAAAWARAVGESSIAREVWECALLLPQVPDEAPSTYSTVFSRAGVATFLAEIAKNDLDPEVAKYLCNWQEGCALKRLVAAPTLCHLARFTRWAHSGVEAEVLKVRRSGSGGEVVVHVAIEMLNFFALPVWVALCVGDPPVEDVTESCQEHGLVTMEYRNCKDSQRGGSIVLCTLCTEHGKLVDMLYCKPYSRVEIGEHTFRCHATLDHKLHFCFLDAVMFGSSFERLHDKVDVRCQIYNETSSEVLIPTTRENVHSNFDHGLVNIKFGSILYSGTVDLCL